MICTGSFLLLIQNFATNTSNAVLAAFDPEKKGYIALAPPFGT